jgi:hypothetical protein
MRLFLIVPFALAGALSGCSTAERVGRPPSAAEIVRINEAAREGRALVVEYTPAATSPGRPALPSAPCAAGSCASPPVQPLCAGSSCPPVATSSDDDPASIDSADERELSLNLRNGARTTLPLEWVSGVKVTAHSRAPGAAIGAAIGGGLEVGALGLLILALRGGNDPGAPTQAQGCTAKCVELFAIVGLEGALIGGIIGGISAPPTASASATSRPRPITDEGVEASPRTGWVRSGPTLGSRRRGRPDARFEAVVVDVDRVDQARSRLEDEGN